MEKQIFENTKFFSGIKALVKYHSGEMIITVMQADFEEMAIWDMTGDKYEY